MIHRLSRQQIIPANLDVVWTYFATPANLNEMTPTDMNFEILAGGEGNMYAGQLIEYRVELLPGIRTHWLTEITHVHSQATFVDEQRIGPYRFWHHQHHFTVIPEGTRMLDIVTYQLPFGWFGDFVQRLWIRRRLDTIFDYRSRKVEELFGKQNQLGE